MLLEDVGRERESRSRMAYSVEGVVGVVTALRLCMQVLGRVSVLTGVLVWS